MKKSLFTIFLALLPLLASADDPVEIKGIYYNLFSKGKIAEVTVNPNDYSGDVVIPKKVKYEGVSYTVRSIGEMAFKHCYDLTSVTIPVGVTSICKEAFAYCKGLTSVTIPDGVITIGYDAFTNCVQLTSVTIPNSVKEIGMFAFWKCEKLKSITIPEGVTDIDVGTFNYCYSLSSVTIPSTVTTIHVSAFENCYSLSTVVIPQNVRSVYKKAFGNCRELQDVYCYAERVSYAKNEVFEGSYPEYITLHVPAAYMDFYKNNEPWSLFKRIVKITGKVKLNKTNATLQKGKTMTLKATATPSTMPDKSMIWKSSNTAVATVTSKGKVKGVKAGTATITCISNVTGAKATCKVTVGYVKLDKTEVTVKKGKTVTLKATVYPSSLSDKSVTWESSNKKIVTVTSGGKMKGIKAGSAVITCTSNATGLSTTCTVTVTKSSSTRSIEGDEDDDEVTGIEDEVIDDPAVVEPFDVYDLSGRKVLNQVTSLDGLPNGIYIVNGKKVVIK